MNSVLLFFLFPCILLLYYSRAYLQAAPDMRISRPSAQPLYDPPDNLQPGVLYYIRYRLYDQRAFIADLFSYAADRYINIRKEPDQAHTITKGPVQPPAGSVAAGVLDMLFKTEDAIRLEGRISRPLLQAQAFSANAVYTLYNSLFLPPFPQPVWTHFVPFLMVALAWTMQPGAAVVIFGCTCIAVMLGMQVVYKLRIKQLPVLELIILTGCIVILCFSILSGLDQETLHTSLPAGYEISLVLYYAVTLFFLCVYPAHTSQGRRVAAKINNFSRAFTPGNVQGFQNNFPPGTYAEGIHNLLGYAYGFNKTREWIASFPENHPCRTVHAEFYTPQLEDNLHAAFALMPSPASSQKQRSPSAQ